MNNGKHGQGTHCTKICADSSAENTPNASKFICFLKISSLSEKPVKIGRNFQKVEFATIHPSLHLTLLHSINTYTTFQFFRTSLITASWITLLVRQYFEWWDKNRLERSPWFSCSRISRATKLQIRSSLTRKNNKAHNQKKSEKNEGILLFVYHHCHGKCTRYGRVQPI